MDGKGDAEQDRNVIRLPREWVGPLDELIPIGPRADALEQERLRRDGAELPGDDDPLEEPVAAADFWTEGASAMHHPIRGPKADPGVDGGRAARRRRWPAIHAVRWPWLAAAVCAAAVAVVSAIGLGEGRPHAADVAAAHVTSRPLDVDPHHGTTVGHTGTTPVQRDVHRTSETHPPRRPVRRRAPRVRHPKSTEVGGGHITIVSTPVIVDEPARSTVPATEEPTVTTAATHHSSSAATSSSQHSSASAGPDTPGSADGCDPKCS